MMDILKMIKNVDMGVLFQILENLMKEILKIIYIMVKES